MDLAIGADRKVYATTNAGGQAFARTVALVTLNTYAHIAAVFAAVDDRRVYLNGGNKVTDDATSKTPAGIDTTSIGRRSTSAPALYASGRIAEAAIYNAALTDDEIAELAAGASPLLVRPDALVAYWPLVGRDYPEPDLVGGFPMSLYPVSTDTGWVICGTGANDASAGTEPWNNTGNITVDDAAFASPNGTQWANGEFTNYLMATNFGHAIPAAATIHGVETRHQVKESYGFPLKLARISVVIGGVVKDTNILPGEVDTTNAWVDYDYGSASELWGEAWTAAIVNAANTGCVLQSVKRAFGNATHECDAVWMKITYQDCACPADHPPVMFYPALDQCVIQETTDGINGKLIGHLATLGAGR
jgi:hypothetical protein